MFGHHSRDLGLGQLQGVDLLILGYVINSSSSGNNNNNNNNKPDRISSRYLNNNRIDSLTLPTIVAFLHYHPHKQIVMKSQFLVQTKVSLQEGVE
jgi:hypothetical protein